MDGGHGGTTNRPLAAVRHHRGQVSPDRVYWRFRCPGPLLLAGRGRSFVLVAPTPPTQGFSKWVVIKGTAPPSADTITGSREFLRRSADPEPYAVVYLAQLAGSVQPRRYAKATEGVRQKCSVNHTSNIVKKAISQANIGTFRPRHSRGTSTSKRARLSPDAMSVAMGLGRWTSPTDVLAALQRPGGPTHADR